MGSLYELVLYVCLATSPFSCTDIIGPGKSVENWGSVAYESRRQCQNSGQAEAAAWYMEQEEKFGKRWEIKRLTCVGYNTLAKM